VKNNSTYTLKVTPFGTVVKAGYICEKEGILTFYQMVNCGGLCALVVMGSGWSIRGSRFQTPATPFNL